MEKFTQIKETRVKKNFVSTIKGTMPIDNLPGIMSVWYETAAKINGSWLDQVSTESEDEALEIHKELVEKYSLTV